MAQQTPFGRLPDSHASELCLKMRKTASPEKDQVSPAEARRLRLVQDLLRESEALRARLAFRSDAADVESVTVRPVGLSREAATTIDPQELSPTTSWWPTGVYPDKALAPPPGWANLSLAAKPCPAIGFIVLGVRGEELSRLVRLVSISQRREMNFIPVFFTDCEDFSSFRGHGYVLEYLPLADRSAVESRLEYLQRKWGVQSVVDLRVRLEP